MSWGNLKMIHEVCDDREYGRDGYGERAGDAGAAYREGYRRGFAEAMKEVSGAYGNRESTGAYGQRDRMTDGYGERRMTPPYYPEYPTMGMREHYDPMGMRGDYPDEMGERRRRRANGQWY